MITDQLLAENTILSDCLEYYNKLSGCRRKELRMMLRLSFAMWRDECTDSEWERIFKYSKIVIRPANVTYSYAKQEYGIPLLEKKYLKSTDIRKRLDDFTIANWIYILTTRQRSRNYEH